MRSVFVLLSMIGLPLAGCLTDDGGDVVCTEIFVSGVNATVTNADTGGVIEGVTLTLTEGDYTETMMELSPGNYAGAGERAGTYTLTVEAEGFETQTIEDIVVDADECHVIPVSETVGLTPN